MGRTDEVKTQAALALADAGKARCTACSRVYPITEVLAVFWGGAPIYVICASCLPATPVVIKQTETGAWVGRSINCNVLPILWWRAHQGA